MKNKTIKKGGVTKTTTKKLTASQRRGFDPNNLDEKSKGFLDLFNLPRKTANDKNTFLNNINNFNTDIKTKSTCAPSRQKHLRSLTVQALALKEGLDEAGP